MHKIWIQAAALELDRANSLEDREMFTLQRAMTLDEFLDVYSYPFIFIYEHICWCLW